MKQQDFLGSLEVGQEKEELENNEAEQKDVGESREEK